MRRRTPPFRIRAVVSGDLVGVLDTLLYDRPEGGARRLSLVRARAQPHPERAGIRRRADVQDEHDHVMCEGEAGLRAHCDRKLSRDLAAWAADPATPPRAGGIE